jgi:hypothetical protein
VTLRFVVSAALLLCALGGLPVVAAPAEAPAPTRAFLGVHLGATASGVHFANYHVRSSAARGGGSAGLLAVLPRTRHSSLQVGAMIRTAGGTYSYEAFDEHTGTIAPRRGTTDLTYLAFPVGIRVSPVSHRSGPFLAMGADVAYLLAYYERVRAGSPMAEFSSHDRSLAHPWGWAGFVSLGTGYSLARHRLFTELTYRHGLASFQRSNWRGIDPDDGTDRALTLALGLWL